MNEGPNYLHGMMIATIVVVMISSVSSLKLTTMSMSLQTLKPAQSVVLITGCDTGFGLLATSQLSKAGYKVVSACLTKEGCAKVDGIAGAVSVLCDVTKETDVRNLASTTEQLLASDDQLRLWAVINNAGIAPLGYVDWMTMDSVRLVMEVNYFGLVSVTKNCLPLLKRTRNSRIINISSVAGKSGLPMFGAYAASKHAVEGFASSLRQELRPWGIHVSNVNPAFMKTPMVTNSSPAMLAEFLKADESIRIQYPTAEEKFRQQVTNPPLELGEDPQVVVDTIVRLVQASNPSLANFSGWQALGLRFFLMLPAVVREYYLGKIDIYAPTTEMLESFQGRKSE